MQHTIFPDMSETGPKESIHFTSVVRSLPPSVPFVAPEALERSHSKRLGLRLGANESAFGASPLAIAAMTEAARQSNWYGDPECHELRSKLSVGLGVPIDRILVGNGIDGLLGYVVRAMVEQGTAVISSRGTYPTFSYHVAAFGGRIHTVAYLDDRPDLSKLLETAKRTQARLVYLANPDNPSGSWHSAADIIELSASLPDGCALLLDEAYYEFAAASSVVPLSSTPDNVIRVRTFSKAHGMAGARVGYLIAHSEVISTVGKFRNQFEVSRVSLAGAVASLGDPRHIQSVIEGVEAGRRDYEAMANSIDCPFIPSATNFVCIDVGGPERARAIVAALLARGAFIRMPGASPLDRCIRVTVGKPEERAEFAEILREVVARV